VANTPPSPPDDPIEDSSPPVQAGSRKGSGDYSTAQPDEYNVKKPNTAPTTDPLLSGTYEATLDTAVPKLAFMHLYMSADSLQATEDEDIWAKFADSWASEHPNEPRLSADAWRVFFKTEVLPQWREDGETDQRKANIEKFSVHLGSIVVRDSPMKGDDIHQEYSDRGPTEIVESSVPTSPNQYQTVIEDILNSHESADNTFSRSQSPQKLSTHAVATQHRKRLSGAEIPETQWEKSPSPNKRRRVDQDLELNSHLSNATPSLGGYSHQQNYTSSTFKAKPISIEISDDSSSDSVSYYDTGPEPEVQVKSRASKQKEEKTLAAEINEAFDNTNAESQYPNIDSELLSWSSDTPRATTESEPDLDMALEVDVTAENSIHQRSSPAPSDGLAPGSQSSFRNPYNTQALLAEHTQPFHHSLPNISGDDDDDDSDSENDTIAAQELSQARKEKQPARFQEEESFITGAEGKDVQSESEDDGEVPLNPTELSDFFTRWQKQGFAQSAIQKALYVSSTYASLAERALQSIHKGLGVPKNIPGIWTTDDDDAYVGGDARKIRKVQEKHGEERCEERVVFLRLWNS
jgi:hypothetical protein